AARPKQPLNLVRAQLSVLVPHHRQSGRTARGIPRQGEHSGAYLVLCEKLLDLGPETRVSAASSREKYFPFRSRLVAGRAIQVFDLLTACRRHARVSVFTSYRVYPAGGPSRVCG